MLDVLIANGVVVDGSGFAPRQANVGIQGDRIVYIGDEHPPAAETIDASGRYVTPGFVDVHTHYDAQVMWDPRLTPQTKHGFTTVLAGNCGFSLAPVSPQSVEYVLPMLSQVESMPLATLKEAAEPRWETTAQMYERLDRGLGCNIGFATGHSTIRSLVMGDRAVGEAASKEDIAAMKGLLKQALDEGSIGFTSSTSTAHRDHRGQRVPSGWASREELLELASVVEPYEGTFLNLVASVRNLTPEEKELLADFSVAGNRTVSWPLLLPGSLDAETLESQMNTADVARGKGGEVRSLCNSSPLESRVHFNGFGYDDFPGLWGELYKLPTAERVERFKDRAAREELRRIAAEVAKSSEQVAGLARFENFRLEAATHPDNQPLIGRRVVDIAAERGTTAFDVCLDISILDQLTAIFRTRPPNNYGEAEWRALAKVLLDDRILWGGTDGGAHVDFLESYSHGTRFLAGAVRDHRVMPIERAINLFTKVPAEFVGLKDRGEIREGAYADILVIDLDRIAITPVEVRSDLPAQGKRIYTDAVGFDHILVNGKETVRNDAYTDSLPGVVLRAGEHTYTARVGAH